MQWSRFKGLFLFLLALFLFLWAIPVRGQTTTLQETDLYPGGSAAVIHAASNGSLFILDRADELWMVDPATGNYKDYYGISGSELYDITLQSPELVWWTDASQMFGTLNINTNTIESWEISEEDYENIPNLGPLSYDSGLIWLSAMYGESNGFFNFDPSTYEICSYGLSIHASDVLIHEGKLYILDWFLDALLRFDPVSGQLVKYDPDRSIGMDANLKSDGSLLWWTEASDEGDILSFDPVTHSLLVYALPAGEKPRNLTLQSGIVWYTNANGSFGRLDPSIVPGVSTVLLGDLISSGTDPVCVNLGEPTIDTASREPDGTFDWGEITSSITEHFAGLQSYSLPTGYEPFGITDASGFIWLTDPGQQKLIRMAIDELPRDNYRVYLPLIIK